MKCPNCQADMSDDVKFCIKCGTRLQPEKKPEENKPEAAQTEEKAPRFCIKCGTKLHEGSKFCTKCGAPTDEGKGKTAPSPAPAPAQTADKAPAPTPAAAPAPKAESAVRPQPVQTAPSPAEPAAPEKKKSSKGILIVAILAIAAIIVAILIGLKSMGVFSKDPSQGSTSSQPAGSTANDDEDEDEDEDDNDDEDDPEPEVDPEAEAARLKEIEEIKAGIEEAVLAGDGSEGISEDYPRAFEGFINLASEYGLADEISADASDVFDKYVAQVNHSIALLDGQKVSSGLYIQSRVYLDDALRYAEELTEAGIEIDQSLIHAESDALIGRYRDKYIAAINEISSRENWSRDEAWQLADDAASIRDENGNTVLFDESDLDDPLRLRYIYCLAWVTRKNIETGLADGSLDANGALDEIDSVLYRTDMNPMLLYDAIQYCGKAKADSEAYSAAYDQIVEKLAENEGITLILDHSRANETNIDLNHFWYFNDISDGADEAYQVSTTNGTTSETRAWIRDNIKVNR